MCYVAVWQHVIGMVCVQETCHIWCVYWQRVIGMVRVQAECHRYGVCTGSVS